MKSAKFIPKSAQIMEVIQRFWILICLFLLSRFIFFGFNSDLFDTFTSDIFWQGIRFDAAAIALINSPYFLFLLLPFPFVEKKISRIIGNCYFVFFNAIALLTNFIDTCYYPFSMRRLTGDIFSFLGETNNFTTLIPVFLKDYAVVGGIWIGFVVLLVLSCWHPPLIKRQRWEAKAIGRTSAARPLLWTKQLGYRVVLIFLLLTAARGGWQLRPLNVNVASCVAGVEHAALVLNSPYSLLTTLHTNDVKRLSYFQSNECKQLFDTQFINDNSVPSILAKQPRPKHIVLLILEGFSTEYSTFLSDAPKPLAGFTPFLDSLAQQSIVFRGYANGQQSIEALTSILGGVPSLLTQPFSQTHYASYPIRYGVAQLQKKDFRTLFFHGGKNGTMGFDRFCHTTGITHYYGMNEYPANAAKKDYDGTWGIFDMPYLQYVTKQLDTITAPFFATIFTLSSHHPFVVPAPYDSRLPKGDFPMQHSVSYTDEALRQFFTYAQKSQWFNETLFVITADHTNFHGATNVNQNAHRYAIPMIFYYPQADTTFRSERIVQQVDILPTICDYCGIKTTFSSFGKSAFNDSVPHFAINYFSGNWRMYIDDYLIEFDGKKITHIWNISQGSIEIPPAQVPQATTYQRLMQAVLQRYYNGLLDNDW